MQITNLLVGRGAGGRGEALRFAAPPQGEQGVMNFLLQILQILKVQTDIPPAAGPSQK